MPEIFKFLRNFLSSGKKELADNETISYSLLNMILLIGALFLIAFGISVYIDGDTVRSLLDGGLALISILAILVLRTKMPLVIPGGVSIAAFGVLCARLIAGGEIRGFGGLWIYIFPLVTIFILGLQIGLIYTFLLFCTMLTLTLVPGLSKYSYTVGMASRFCGVYVLVTMLTVAYERVRLAKDRRVDRLTRELQIERDLITTMKDNLKAGLFLMNRDFVIQGAYSKPLETILETDEIEGKKLTSFLAASLKAKERDTLEDYFNMVINRQFEAAMLEDINPITEFTYMDDIRKKKKIIRTSFSSVDMGFNDFYIMGSFEDISAAKELERQLAAEANKREEEMRALFQVIQVDPTVFGDFIEDSEYEFDRINENLKNQDLSAKEAIVEIYQSVHAIKSNALILGLDNFSGKLHELENVIKQYRDNDTVSFEDVLHVTVELEKIMQEKDKFRNIIEKIESFRRAAGGNRRQDRYVLVETLSRACKKAAEAQKKQVSFTVEELDGSILANGPRRIIKEVLTQLARNAVYHGIESPEDRVQKGKSPEGAVTLSITRDKNTIHLKLSDDGRGLDFDKIRKKALELNLLQKEAGASDKNQLLQVIFAPGFSTADSADVHAGRGIGLNLVRDRIRNLHGSIKLSSEPGRGTVFNIFIPFETATEESKAS
jgi:two-component system chemotaxis sensor kinase CheA